MLSVYKVSRPEFVSALNNAIITSALVSENVGEVPEDADYYLDKSNTCGFCVTHTGILNCVFNVGERGRGKSLVKAAQSVGAKSLDCFDGYLVDFYKARGFKVVRVDENWNGPECPPVVYMEMR